MIILIDATPGIQPGALVFMAGDTQSAGRGVSTSQKRPAPTGQSTN